MSQEASVTSVAEERTSAIPPEELAALTDDIIAALKSVYDPEPGCRDYA